MKYLKKKVLIFDVDGVLIDSKKNMELSWKHVQEVHHLKNKKFKEYFRNIGRPFYDILKIMKINKNFEKIKISYQKESLKQKKQIQYFKDVKNILKKLKSKNFILTILTSKDIKRTKNFLKNQIKHFSLIECNNDSIKGKPHPDQILKIISKLKVSQSDCVYIGDTNIDYLTAKNSKIDFVFAEWGYGKNYNYKYKCKKIKDLIKYIKVKF